MLSKLIELTPTIQSLLFKPDVWDSLIINRRKPYTYRIFTMIGDIRVCLHRFDECKSDEAFMHPHPWPGAFNILAGGYYMKLGRSVDRESPPVNVAEMYLNYGSAYEITDELTWHSVAPVGPAYTVMINGEPFKNPHKDVRTTRGKDLEKMTGPDLLDGLDIFKKLFTYNSQPQDIVL